MVRTGNKFFPDNDLSVFFKRGDNAVDILDLVVKKIQLLLFTGMITKDQARSMLKTSCDLLSDLLDAGIISGTQENLTERVLYILENWDKLINR